MTVVLKPFITKNDKFISICNHKNDANDICSYLPNVAEI